MQNIGMYGVAFAQLFAVQENYNVFTLVKEFTSCKEILQFIYKQWLSKLNKFCRFKLPIHAVERMSY